MIRTSQRYIQRNAGARLRGLTLVECMLASLILAGVLMAAMQAAAISGSMQTKSAQRATARFLARALAADLSCLLYQDPGASPVFGREAGESAASKANYNDVDDFNGWVESPPQDRDGKPLDGMNAYQRSVTVEWVNPSNFNQVMGSESGVKRITITVSRNNAVLATWIFLRSQAPS